jgi:voltage-gated potassium channel Kch
MGRLVRHREVTRGTLLGSVSGYLLIALTYFYLFLALERLLDEHFFGVDVPTQSFMYFSLVTITTTGYGDLAAQSDLGRLLATSEAVIGQIYLVTFVAMIVGLFISGRRTFRLSGDPDASLSDDSPSFPQDSPS